MATIKNIYIRLYRFVWWLLNFWRFKALGYHSYIEKTLKITPSFIDIGKRVYISKFSRIEGIKLYNNKVFSPIISIENNVTIQQNIHLTCANSVVIKKNTAIAANVTITDIHHPYEDINIPIEKQDIVVKSVIIGEDSKIYNNVVILPGTKIGRHCTIGANSTVFGAVPDYSVAVGSPAKIIKRYCFKDNAWKKTNENGKFIN
jgi:acetyltransferase-like isoleucine patch superfamily enzyme